MLIDIYAIRTGRKLETVERDLGSEQYKTFAATRMREIEDAYVARCGVVRCGVIAIPRMGKVQREGLELLARREVETECPWSYMGSIGNRAMMRLCDFAFVECRLSGGGASGGSWTYRITDRGLRAAKVLFGTKPYWEMAGR